TPANRLRRLMRTALIFLPLVPLGFLYLQMSERGGPMHPTWENLRSAYSVSAWGDRLGWVDPVTLARKDALPFTHRVAAILALLAPVIWLSAAGIFWWAGRLSPAGASNANALSTPRNGQDARSSENDAADNRGQGVWLLLSALLVLAGVIGPDSLGSGHG